VIVGTAVEGCAACGGWLHLYFISVTETLYVKQAGTIPNISYTKKRGLKGEPDVFSVII
jgi:hypothetical protein